YACTLDGQVYALNASTGGLLWEKSLNGSPLAPAAVEAVLVVATREGEVTAFDRNGGVMWRSSFEDGITYGPAIHNGGVWFATGKKLFVMENGNVEKVLEFQASVTSFSLKDGEAYVCLEDGTVRSVKDGEVGWSFTSPAGAPHSMAVAENTIFVSCGNRLFCLEHGTGEAIWEMCIRGDSLAVAYGKIFMTSEDGGIYCIGSWGKAQNESFIAGLAYICAAAVLAFLLYMLGRKTGKRR
ncbi:MAG: PQQ-binding-like beta-propeller repeat protein, partial [Candidatus Hadarchaeales archaeon]